MKKHLFVFDIDNTITASITQHLDAFVSTMRAFGVKNIDQNWERYLHVTDSHVLKENYENNLPEKFDWGIIPEFENQMITEIEKLPPSTEVLGAENMLQWVNAQNEIYLCFATGSLRGPALVKLNQAGVTFEEEVVMGANNHFSREEIVQASVQKAMQHYGLSHVDETIAFGDGIWDLKTAKNLGYHFVGIGNKAKPEFDAYQAASWIEDWNTFDWEKIQTELKLF